MSKIETNTIAPSTGTTLTLGENGDTVTLGTGATQSGFGGTNTPAFKAKLSSSYGISNATTTKIDFDTEMFDTDNLYDTVNQRFTPTSAGKYFISAQVYFDDAASTDATRIVYIYKDGSEHLGSNTRTVGSTGRGSVVRISDLVDLSVGEYIEIFGYTNAGATTIGSGSSRFYGYKIIE
jgi:hypothetical protein